MKFLIILMSVLLISSCKVYEGASQNTYDVDGFKVYTALHGVSQKTSQAFRNKGVKKAIILNGGKIDTGMDLTVQRRNIIAYVRQVVPNPNSDAIIVINIEGDKMNTLNRTKDNALFEKVLNYKIEVLKIVKETRPYATVGYYGYPFRDYWNRNENWRAKNEKLLPLLEASDALFPSVYDFYADGVDVKEEKDMAYVKDNVEESLRLAYDLDIPVFPFVWHRYHVSNKKRSRTFIDLDEFSNHISAITQAYYQGTKASGIVWWSSEQYFYNIEKKKSKMKTLRSRSESFEQYSTRTTLPYLQAIENGIRKGQNKAR